MTKQEITQARADLELLDIEQLRCGVMLQLLNIEALTKERDAALEQNTELDANLAKMGAAGKRAMNVLLLWQEWEDIDDPDKPASDALAALREAGVQ